MDTKKTKGRVQAEQQIFHLLINISEMYPQYTLSQHLCHVLRRKNEKKEPYWWETEVLLKKFEEYYDELKNDLLTLPLED